MSRVVCEIQLHVHRQSIRTSSSGEIQNIFVTLLNSARHRLHKREIKSWNKCMYILGFRVYVHVVVFTHIACKTLQLNARNTVVLTQYASCTLDYFGCRRWVLYFPNVLGQGRSPNWAAPASARASRQPAPPSPPPQDQYRPLVATGTASRPDIPKPPPFHRCDKYPTHSWSHTRSHLYCDWVTSASFVVTPHDMHDRVRLCVQIMIYSWKVSMLWNGKTPYC